MKVWEVLAVGVIALSLFCVGVLDAQKASKKGESRKVPVFLSPKIKPLQMKDEGGLPRLRIIPPSMDERSGMAAPPRQTEPSSLPMRPTVEELERQLMTSPDGADVLEKARRGVVPTGARSAKPGFFFSRLNSVVLSKAEAQAPFTLTLSHTMTDDGRYNLCRENPSARVYLYGVYEHCEEPSRPYVYLTSYLGEDGTDPFFPPNPYYLNSHGIMEFVVRLPEDGWYIFNVNAATPYETTTGKPLPKATLRHREDTRQDSQYPILQTWDMPLPLTGTLDVEYRNYPFLGYFRGGPGLHQFYWTFTTPVRIAYITVDSYPQTSSNP